MRGSEKIKEKMRGKRFRAHVEKEREHRENIGGKRKKQTNKHKVPVRRRKITRKGNSKKEKESEREGREITDCIIQNTWIGKRER